MAHKTIVGGTQYNVKKGKALIGGTEYSVKKGKTLVGGTAYEVGFSNMLTLTLKGYGCGWIEINGSGEYADNYELEVESGTILSYVYYSSGRDRNLKITVNGTTVVNTKPSQYKEYRYDYTITKNTMVTVTNPGGDWTEVTITET